LAVLALAVGGCSLASEPVPAVPIEIGPLPGEAVTADLPISLPRASEGALIYLEHCAACHGEGGQGDADYAAGLAEQGVELVDLSEPALARRRSPQDWYRVISDGTASMGGLMPSWRESLTDAERWNVATYLYTFSAPEDLLVEGEALYEANCAECHGESGELEGLDDFAGLAALSREAIYRDYVASRSRGGGGRGRGPARRRAGGRSRRSRGDGRRGRPGRADRRRDRAGHKCQCGRGGPRRA
jgi:mono/diheme cytochrome c family protein